MRKLIIVSFMSSFLFLVGCNDSFVEKARETQGKQEENKEITAEKTDEELKRFYEEYEKPVSESLHENDLDKVNTIDSRKNELNEINEEDPQLFSQYVAAVLFSFENGELEPDLYYEFLSKYGSEDTVEDLPESKEDGIHIFESIQDLYIENGTLAQDYELTELQFSQGKVEAYFYRKVTRNKKEEFYITTIVKESGKWKFSDDSPSAPFIEQDDE